MKKKTKIIISSIGLAVVILGIAIWVILPRAALGIMADKYIVPSIDYHKGGYFDGYDVRNDSFKRVENEFIALEIPSGFELEKQPDEEKKNLPHLKRYERNDTKETVLLFAKPNDTVMDMTDYAMYAEDEKIPDEKAFKRLLDTFESFGNGIPDSRFAAYKCIVLLDKDDYSFWDMDKATAFTVLGTFRLSALSVYKDAYVYESDNICGILYLSENSRNGKYEAAFDAYPVSDLNYSYTIMMYMNSLEDIYAVINSVEFIEDQRCAN